MKKLFLAILTFAIINITAKADEGMWLLPLLQKMNIKTMNDLGCKLSAKEIYDINNSSLKDAIVQFGGGCTGEVISNDGLIVTNHHCGYSYIQQLSSTEHNYLENGYWAMSREQEIPAKGLTVSFLVEMKDITDILNKVEKEVLKRCKNTEYKEDTYLIVEGEQNQTIEKLKEEMEKAHPNCQVIAKSFYNKNVYYLIAYKVFKDVRFVGAPPASVGKFGGDTDNWMWPRHTGDFSMFRVYASKDNEPAEYSKDNVPYHPKKSLTINLQGVKEGDFTFIMGYPGRTQRFQTASQLREMLNVNDIRIEARTIRQNLMMKAMESDPKIRLQYASKYAHSSNAWKKWQGMKIAFNKLNIIPREEEKEAKLNEWIHKKKSRANKYGGAIEQISSIMNEMSKVYENIAVLQESIMNIAPIGISKRFLSEFDKNLKSMDSTKAVNLAIDAVMPMYKDYNEKLEESIAEAMFDFYQNTIHTNIGLESYPCASYIFDKRTGEELAKAIFDSSSFVNINKLNNLRNLPVKEILKDPIINITKSFIKDYTYLIEYRDESLSQPNTKGFAAALLDWNKDKPIYPDANFTMRLTYGTVKGYSPKDAIAYRYYTTLQGVMEKADPKNYDFLVPEKLSKLAFDKDFGQYQTKDGKLVTCFITNNDITGGNSGSPVLNANGELIGLAFDGNWESMSSDVMFEPELQRCICVDIRYVLFLVDKLGGAGYLLNEMNIIK